MSKCITQSLNALPPTYANAFPRLPLALSVKDLCHPIILQTYKPVLTTADGNCMYHALSRVVCGNEQLSTTFRLLIAYAVVKYKDVMVQSIQDAFPLLTHEQSILRCNRLLVEALQVGTWGSDHQLFIYSFTIVSIPCRRLTLSDCINVSDFSRLFLSHSDGTSHHLCCSSTNRVLLSSGDVTTLPHLPLSLLHAINIPHQVCSVLAHHPLPVIDTYLTLHMHSHLITLNTVHTPHTIIYNNSM